MKKFLLPIILLGLSISPSIGNAETNQNTEMAARINVAENICGVNFGDRLLHHVMLSASELNVSLETAARLADARHQKIVRYLNRTKRLDQFCANARAGKL